MNKTLRTVILFAVVALLFVSIVPLAFAEVNVPVATSDFYVNDFAGVFTAEEKTKLIENAVSLANEHNGIQVVVTTVKSLEGNSVEDYAHQMYNQYGIGKDDMGLLILLATEDRQIRVEVGRAMEGYINDAKAGRFMDKYAIPYLKENKFNEGLINLQQAFVTEIKSCVTSGTTNQNNNGVDINIDWGAVLFTILIVAASGGVIWLIIFAVNKIRKKKQEKAEYIQGLKDQIEALKNKISKLNTTIANQQDTNDNLKWERNQLYNKLEATNRSLAALDDRYKRVLTIYPDADKKVDEMIEAEKVARDKTVAKMVDKLIESVINLKPDKDLVARLLTVKSAIDALNSDEAKYLESDVARFNKLYSKCCTLKREYDEKVEQERRRKLTEQRKYKAEGITKQLLSIISMVGIVHASDLSKLKNAKALYEGLDSETKSYVDSCAISKIEELFRRAKRAKQEEEEEEERRRRQASYNSTSSYSSGASGFGGFGGRSGGGGASRGF